MQRLILYGAGRRCEKLLKLLFQSTIQVIGIVDSNPEKWGTYLENYQINSPYQINQMQDANICITVANACAVSEIRNKLQKSLHFNMEKELNYEKLYFEALAQSEEIVQFMQKHIKAECSVVKPVLFALYDGFMLGGVEEWTKDICGALIKSGKDNIYIISKKGCHDVPPLFKDCMLHFDVQKDSQENSILNAIKIIMEKLPCQIVTTKPDIIMMAAYLIKYHFPNMIRVISTIRGSNKDIYQKFMALKDIPDLFIGVSQDIKNDFIQMGIHSEKVYSMCVPFECEKEIVREYEECMKNPIRIGYAGRLEYSDKRMDLLMKLVKELVDRNVPFKMEIAGDGRAYFEIKKFICSNLLNEKIKMLGLLERIEIPAFWRRQDICVNISDYEGRCHSIVEAMGNGAVPIVTATSGVKEDIVDDVNGYIVPIGDYCAMADRIEHLSQNRKRLCEMGRLAHDVVYPKSRIETHLKFWNEILENK